MIYIKRHKEFTPAVGVYRSKGKVLKGWCAEMSYDTWLKISGIELIPGRHKKIEIREVDE